MLQLHMLFYAITLGLGAAIPIGPVNLEIIRRNLRYSTKAGILLGFGASCTDLTYVVFLCLGAMTLLNHAIILNSIGIIGSFILAWFGYSALRHSTPGGDADNDNAAKNNQPALWKNWRDGYLMTALNPMTILFWTSVSSQVASLSHQNGQALWFMAIGIIIGAFGWALGLNTVLHHTRHRISNNIMLRMNQLGGVLLIALATFGLIRALIHIA